MSEKHSFWKKRLSLAIIILFALYVLFGFVGLPLLVRHVGLKKANELIEGELTVGSIRSNPFTWSLTLQEIQLTTPDEGTLFSAKRFHGDFAFWSLFAKGWRFEEILLSEPQLNVSVDEHGQLNALALLKKQEAKPEATEADEITPIAIPLVKVDSLKVEDGGLELKVDMPEYPFSRSVKSMSFELIGFSTDPQKENPYSFRASTTAGERSEIIGHLRLNPLSTSGTVTVENINLSDYDALAGESRGFDLTEGSLSFSVDYLFSPVSEPRGLSWSKGNFSLKGIKIKGKDDSDAPFLSLAELTASGLTIDLLKGSVHLEKFLLADAYLHIARNKQGELNLINYLLPGGKLPQTASTAQQTEAVPVNSSMFGDIRLGVLSDNQDIGVAISTAIQQIESLLSERWQVSIDELAIENNSLELTDNFPSQDVHCLISAINVKGSDVRNFGAEPFPLELSVSPCSGHASLSAQITPEPTAVTFSYEAADINLAPFAAYLPLTQGTKVLHLGIAGNGKGSVQLAGKPLPQANIELNGRVENIRIAQQDSDTPVIDVNAVALDSATISTNPLALHAKRLEVNAPKLTVIRDADGQINLLQMLPLALAEKTDAAPAGETTKAAKTAATDTAKAADIDLENFVIDEFVILGGQLNLQDKSVTPPAAFSIKDASFSLKPVVLNPKVVSIFEAQAALANGASGRVGISGSIILIDPLRSVRLDILSEAVTLTPFAGYSAQMVGRPFEQGKLDAKLGYSIEKNTLKGDNDVKMHLVEFGSRQPDSKAPNLPLNLGMAILKDRSGTMHLDIPVSGDLKDPGFSLASVIQYAIINVFEKLVTSPFAALGSLLGPDSAQPATEVVFVAGSSDIPSAAATPLALLADALSQRPGLNIALVPSPLAAADLNALREQALQQRLEAYAAENKVSVGRATERLYDEANNALSAEAASLPTNAAVETAGESVASNTAEPQLQVKTVTNSAVRTTRRGLVPYFNIWQTQTLVPVEAAQPAATTDASDTAARQIDGTPEAAQATAQAPASATKADAASTKAASTGNTAPAELTLEQKRAVLLAQTKVPSGSAEALASARALAVSSALTGDSAHPLEPERITVNSQGTIPQDKQPAPAVWFELGAGSE